MTAIAFASYKILRLRRADKLLYTVPGVPRFGTIKTGEPPGSSPGDILANQIRTLVPPVSQVALPRERIPSLSVIFSPGSKIGHTPRK